MCGSVVCVCVCVNSWVPVWRTDLLSEEQGGKEIVMANGGQLACFCLAGPQTEVNLGGEEKERV